MRRIFNDVATLAARIGVGGIFFVNGWEKLEAGLNATTEQFAQQGAPLPNVWAALAMLIELLGGAMLIAGFAVPICGILLFVEALAVFIVASGDQGQPLTGGDTNLIVALGAASILLAVVGAGRVSVDHMVVIKRRETDDAPDPDAEADAMLAALRDPHPRRGALGSGSSEPTSASAAGAAPKSTSKAAPEPALATTPRRTRDAQEKNAPVRTATPPAPADGGGGGTASSGAAESPAKARKPRQRRTDTGSDSTTASPSEAPVAAEKGDRLVAGRREGTTD